MNVDFSLDFSSVIVADGNSLMHRFYHANPLLSSKEGFPTGAIFGTIRKLIEIKNTFDPAMFIICFDFGKKNFRHDLFPEYKGNRPPTDEQLIVQFPKMKEILKAAKIQVIELENFEGDDCVGSVCRKLEQMDYTPYILSGDGDMFQLVNEKTKVLYMSSDGLELYDEAKVTTKKGGLPPAKVIEIKGLMGDTSDNIAGVAGVGEKTAIKLLLEYNDIEGVYENIENIKGKLKEKLEIGKNSAFLSRKLATIVTDLDIEIQEVLDYSFETPQVKELLSQLDIVTI